jgi:hypothetical protein
MLYKTDYISNLIIKPEGECVFTYFPSLFQALNLIPKGKASVEGLE